jgi:hypothetical protein
MRREVFEETGIQDMFLGPPMWQGSILLEWCGTPTLSVETLAVAQTNEETLQTQSMEPQKASVFKRFK